MKNGFIFFVIACTLCFCIQELSAQSKPDSIASYFSVLQSIPQEKLYLHLDKPYYGAGDHIWYKGYLVNAISHRDDSKSNFIITELLIVRTLSYCERRSGETHWGFKMFLNFRVRYLPETITCGDIPIGC